MAIDLTPQRMKCAIQMACPSVHRLEDGRYLIVGHMEYDWRTRELGGKPGPEEMGVTIPANLLENVLKCQAGDVQTGAGSAPTAFQSGAFAEAWRPMDTAPRPEAFHWADAPVILAWTENRGGGGYPVLVRWAYRDRLWLSVGVGAGLRDQDLCAWMPVPPDPQRQIEEAQRADERTAEQREASLTPKES